MSVLWDWDDTPKKVEKKVPEVGFKGGCASSEVAAKIVRQINNLRQYALPRPTGWVDQCEYECTRG